MTRIHFLNDIRRKQGYDFSAHLTKTARKGKKVTRDKVIDLFIPIGILVGDSAMDSLFVFFGTGKKNEYFDLDAFAADLAKVGEPEEGGGDHAATGGAL